MKADVVDDWWRMADEMRNGKESEYKEYLAIVVVVIFLVLALGFYVRENNYLRRSLNEANAERERLREELLSERERFHNIPETN